MLANEAEATAAVQQLRDERSSVDWYSLLKHSLSLCVRLCVRVLVPVRVVFSSVHLSDLLFLRFSLFSALYSIRSRDLF
jgi:hypothetical protein